MIREPDGVDFVIGPSRMDVRSVALLGAWIRAHKQGAKAAVTYALEPRLTAEELLAVVDEMLGVESPPALDRADAAAMRQADVIVTARVDGWLVGAAWIMLDHNSETQPLRCVLDPMFVEHGIEEVLTRLVVAQDSESQWRRLEI